MSSLHWNVPDSVELNANAALVDVVGLVGAAVIVVFGAVVSPAALTVHVCVAGEASALPAASVASTLNVCEPVVRPL